MKVVVFSNVREYSDEVGRILANKCDAVYHADVDESDVDENVNHVYNAPMILLPPDGSYISVYIYVNLQVYNNADMKPLFDADREYRLNKSYWNHDVLQTADVLFSVYKEKPEDIASLLNTHIINKGNSPAFYINPAYLVPFATDAEICSKLRNSLVETYKQRVGAALSIQSSAVFTMFGSMYVSGSEFVQAAQEAGIKMVRMINYRKLLLPNIPLWYAGGVDQRALDEMCNRKLAMSVLREELPIFESILNDNILESVYWSTLARIMR